MAKSNKAKLGYLDANMAEVDNIAAGNIAFVRFTFADGLGNLDVDLAKIGSNVLNTAMVRGVAEKIRDDYAGAETADEALGWAKDIVERLYGDEWYGEREGGGPTISLFIEAVRMAKEKDGHPFDEQATRAKWLGKDKAKARNAALSGNATLRAMYAKLGAEKAAKVAANAAKRALDAANAAAGEAQTDGDSSAL